MLIQPKKTKYRKYFKPRGNPIKSNKQQTLSELNCFALISLESGFLNGRQIEAARQSIRRKVKREGKLEIRVLPDITITRKPSSARMGKGKGKVDYWVASISPGKILFLLYGLNPEQAIRGLRAGANKLPFKIKIYQA